jgi:hypothetical protein
MILKAAGHDVIGHHDADCCGHEKALRAFLASSCVGAGAGSFGTSTAS